MISVLIIEDFVIHQMFRPYLSEFVRLPMGSMACTDEIKRIEGKLRRRPECIITMLERNPETKELIFQRLRNCGVEFYRYLNMDTQIIQYVRKELGNGINREPKAADSGSITE